MFVQKTTKTVAVLEALKKGDLSFEEYLDGFEAHLNSIEPQIQAFVPEEGRFERLRREADALAEKYPDPDLRPPLYGLLIGVKDIFHVNGFETHAGSRLPPAALSGTEAECVTTLKEVGALVMGKTVTTEFAYFAPGPTRNPHNLKHTPGGSSSGSAAAVAAGLVPLAFGTQTIGSITRPASFCGVFGYKPSYDRISRAGVIPLSSSVDHIGFFTGDLEMAQLAAGLLCKNWEKKNEAVEKPVLGVPEGPYLEKATPEMLAHFRSVCQKLAKSGYEVMQVDTMSDFDEIVARHNTIVAAEAAQTHATCFAKYEELYHSKTAELIRRGQTISEAELEAALESRLALRSDLTSAMADNHIDLWLSPAAIGPAPKGLDSTGDPIMNLPWTHSGLPTLNLPSGISEDGLPLGLQVAAGWYQDEKLFAWSMPLANLLDRP